MWVLDVVTFKLHRLHEPPPQYAILSHTWEEDEVEFHDMGDVRRARQKSGWTKIQLTCDEAKRNQLPYAWIDTCCIDKSSSAELSEAINSMFKWYQRATSCYAYLSDLDVQVNPNAPTISRTMFHQLSQCQWFTRGWTLQELIAPTEVVFFNRKWESIGTKESLKHDIAEITLIDIDVLDNTAYLAAVPIGRRMSWASKRRTTRIEDMAYCLLGIFDINMPLLYGEGQKAFLRLQQEIARQHRDLSLFAWRQDQPHPEYRGIFASSPSEFSHCSLLLSRGSSFFAEPNFSVTDANLQIDVCVKDHLNQSSLTLGLECMDIPDPATSQGRSEVYAITLQRFGDVYVRSLPHTTEPTSEIILPGRGSHSTLETTSIHVKPSLPRSHSDFISLMRERKLFLLYRKGLRDSMQMLNGAERLDEINPEIADPIRQTCLLNDIDPSIFGIIQKYGIDIGGGYPIWWDAFTLLPSPNTLDTKGFVVVCGIPLAVGAPSERLLPWFALFSTEDISPETREMASLLLNNHWRDSSAEVQRHVGDTIFRMYADHSGTILQSNLPVAVSFGELDAVYEVRLTRLGGGGTTWCADVQYGRLI